MHRQPPGLRHSAPGARAPERFELRRGRARLRGKILRLGGRGFDKRLAFAFETALARPPRPEETKVLRDLFENQLKRYQADKTAARLVLTIEDAPAPKRADSELAAWMQVSRAILNLHETITRN